YGRAMGKLSQGIEKVSDGYAFVVRRLVRFALLSILLVVGFGGIAYLLNKTTPTGFLPEEDQGLFFIQVNLPAAASQSRTAAVVSNVENMVREIPGVADVTSVTGFSFIDGLSESNAGLLIISLKPFDERVAERITVFDIMN
ncbi:efflux RND transporter permease subunit, partial [Rhizobiaceae sp. 2RAB30]